MPRPYQTIDSVPTSEGALKLLKRGDADFMITVGGRVLMSTALTHSEKVLAEKACQLVNHLPAPRVLIGGMGLGFTLRAALDHLPSQAQVTVADLNEEVVRWCRGPAAQATQNAALDSRVDIYVGDVMEPARAISQEKAAEPYDAIIWDLYVGPLVHGGGQDKLYGDKAVRINFGALKPGGVFAVWGEEQSPAFEARLKKAGFEAKTVVTKGGGVRHAVFIGVKPQKASAQL